MSDQFEKRQDRLEGLLRQLAPAQIEPEHPILEVWAKMPMDALLWINGRLRDLGHPYDFRVEEELTNEALRMVEEGTLPPRHTPPSGRAPDPEPRPEQTAQPAPAPEPVPDPEPRAPARESDPGRFGLRAADPTHTAPLGLPPNVPRVVDFRRRRR